jgi:hypothetical protein
MNVNYAYNDKKTMFYMSVHHLSSRSASGDDMEKTRKAEERNPEPVAAGAAFSCYAAHVDLRWGTGVIGSPMSPFAIR